MSFILDALRKAEDKNRDRHHLPVIQGPKVLDEDLPPRAEARRFPLWLLAIPLVIGAAWWWSASDSEPVSAPAAVTAPVATQSAPTQPTDRPALPQAVPRETGARSLDREVSRGQRTPIDRVDRAPTAAATPVVTPGTVAPGSITPGTVTIIGEDNTTPDPRNPEALDRRGTVEQEVLPEYRESLASGEVPIPKLHLDMHVYSAESAKRFVFINLDKYGEGEAIDDDTTVESIEPQGAVINHKGFRFVLRPD
ncbi:MAG: general secretion pathway protein GspB [Pseudomonadota bacterium]